MYYLGKLLPGLVMFNQSQVPSSRLGKSAQLQTNSYNKLEASDVLKLSIDIMGNGVTLS